MADRPGASPHNLYYSSYREMLVEYLFAGEVMRFLWRRGNVRMEVLKPQVDEGGYGLSSSGLKLATLRVGKGETPRVRVTTGASTCSPSTPCASRSAGGRVTRSWST